MTKRPQHKSGVAAILRNEIKDEAAWVAYKAAYLIKKKINENNRLGRQTVLGLATGSTPEPLYAELIRLYRQEGLDFSQVITFNLDEYLGLGPDHPQSYHHFMREKFFKHVNIPEKNIHLLDGTLKDPQAIQKHLRAYEDEIFKAGGIDIQILGIGGNGHIAFNEPGSNFNSRTRLVELDKKTRADNARFFANPNEVPTHAMTMGIGTILRAEQILLLATGTQKAEIVEKILTTTKPTEAIPATALSLHPNTTLLLDRQAAKLVLSKTRNNHVPLFKKHAPTSPISAVALQANQLSARL